MCNLVILIPVYTVATVSLFPITSQHERPDASASHPLTGISETSQRGVGLIGIRDEAAASRSIPVAARASFVRLFQGFFKHRKWNLMWSLALAHFIVGSNIYLVD